MQWISRLRPLGKLWEADQGHGIKYPASSINIQATEVPVLELGQEPNPLSVGMSVIVNVKEHRPPVVHFHFPQTRLGAWSYR